MSKTNSAKAVAGVNATAARKMKLIVDIRFFRVSRIDEKKMRTPTKKQFTGTVNYDWVHR
jgi:hypothetical protein